MRAGVFAAVLLVASQAEGGAMDEKQLARSWVEVREEGGADRIVLRPETYAIPPARGRRGLDLSRPAAAVAKAPGPTDKTEGKPGSWSLSGDELTIDAPGWSGTYTVEQVSGNILVLRRK